MLTNSHIVGGGRGGRKGREENEEGRKEEGERDMMMIMQKEIQERNTEV